MSDIGKRIRGIRTKIRIEDLKMHEIVDLIHELEDRVAEVEQDCEDIRSEAAEERDEWKSIAKESLASFRLTQPPECYAESHWSRRAEALLKQEETQQ